jgi:hypothetical protein
MSLHHITPADVVCPVFPLHKHIREDFFNEITGFTT